MEIIKLLTWLSIIFLFYSYIGYALLVWMYLKIKKNKSDKFSEKERIFEPSVSLVVAVYNEADIIRKKIENCLLLNYPKNKLKIIFVADGSTDNTEEIIREYPEIELLYKKERKGKVAAINRAMTTIKTEFVIFCDGNTFLNKDSVKEIIKHYTDEKIGAVAGEKKVVAPANLNKPIQEGEGIYWKYESILKKIDSDFYSVVGAAGELFSIRTKLFEPVPTEVLLDDFIISLRICQKGYKVVYEPKSYAIEAPSLTIKDEQKRKIRISAGGFQSIIMLKELLNIFKYGKLTFLYFSHRVSRWMICPILLPFIFISNFIIVNSIGYNVFTVYHALFSIQLIFYSMALLGWLFSIRNIKSKLFYIPYYFAFMNFALYIGFYNFITKKQTVLWHKAKRQ